MYNYTKGCGMVIFGFGIICGTTDLIVGDAHLLILLLDGMLLAIGGLLTSWERD